MVETAAPTVFRETAFPGPRGNAGPSGASVPREPVTDSLIVDADPVARALLRTLLERSGAVRVVEEAGTMEAGAGALSRHDYGLVILDILSLGDAGRNLVSVAQLAGKTLFVTVPDEHALRASGLKAADCILKPVTTARLSDALRRINHLKPVRSKEAPTLRISDRIFLRGAAGGGRFVAVGEIVAVVSLENYSEVLLADGERWLIRRTMNAWEHLLPRELFMRTHRTAIANLGFVVGVSRGRFIKRTTLTLRGVPTKIPVSRSAWPMLRVPLHERGAR